jgi:enoyl-CoA hydratase/carnithine racemase
MSGFTEILLSVETGVATLVLNRPDKLNAWTPTMEKEVKAALTSADADPAIHAIVITGAGRGFCAGADLKAGGSGPRAPVVDGEGDFDQRYSYLLALQTPLVAAINGPAAGVGLCIALYCDFRFMAEGAKLTTAFARRGLIAEHGSAWLLPRLVGPLNAMDLLMTGRNVLAAEAGQMGLAKVLPDEGFLAAVQDWTRDLVTASSPRALRVIKRQVYAALTGSLGDAVRLSNEEQRQSFESEDFREGVAAFREGRKPQFTGR